MIAAIILFLSGCGYDIALNEGDSYTEIHEGDNVTLVSNDGTENTSETNDDTDQVNCGTFSSPSVDGSTSYPVVRFDTTSPQFARDLLDSATLNGDFATMGGCGMGVMVNDYMVTIDGMQINNRPVRSDELENVSVSLHTQTDTYTTNDCWLHGNLIQCSMRNIQNLEVNPMTGGVPFELTLNGLPDMDDYTPFNVGLYFLWTDIETGLTSRNQMGWFAIDHDSMDVWSYCNTCPYGAQCQYDIEVAGNGDGTGNRVMTSSVDPSIALVSSMISSGPPGVVDIMQFEVTNNDLDCGPMDLNVVWLEVQASDYGFTGWSDTVSSRLYSHQTSRMIWEGSFENGYFTRVLIGETIPAGETYSYTLTVNTLEATPGDYVNARSMLNGFEFTDSNGVNFWTAYIEGLPFQSSSYEITNP